jgi:hypothetical protein
MSPGLFKLLFAICFFGVPHGDLPETKRMMLVK